MTHRRIRGRINYVTDGVGEMGREWFTITAHSDGTRTYRAYTEMDDVKLVRDCIYSVDHLFRPLDCFMRVTVDDQLVGTGWFRFADGSAECEAFTAEMGRVSQRWPVDGHPLIFSPHAIAGDMPQLGLFDKSSAETVMTIRGRLSSSAEPNGSTGPILGHGYSGEGRPGEIDLEYVGPEEVTVPAGTYACEHFRILRDERPPLEFWSYTDDLIPVKLSWGALSQTYELMELEIA